MLIFILLVATKVTQTSSETFTIGYLTGSQRKDGDAEYQRPGLTICGAISLAVERINQGRLGAMGHKLEFTVKETYGEELISVKETAELWKSNIFAYIGPQETCEHEAFMAAAFNLPMISYYCTHSVTSDKRKFPTFARTKPPDAQISKSVASVLLYFNWTHVVFFYLKAGKDLKEEYTHVPHTIEKTLRAAGITVNGTYSWNMPYHHGYGDNPFRKMVEETYMDTRIYVILGHYYEHMGLLIAMEEKKLFDKGEYFVVGVDIEQYDADNPTKYLKGLLKEDSDITTIRGYRNYLGVLPTPPIGFQNFTFLVNEYMEKPPFNFPNPLTTVGGVKMIRAEAAYLYDAVQLYAKALMKALQQGLDPRNGTMIIDSLKMTSYYSAMGYMVFMDENGDAEGNYTLIARRPFPNGTYGLFPVGVFSAHKQDSRLPSLSLMGDIDWVNGKPPIAIPPCGFKGEKCVDPSCGFQGGNCRSYLVEIICGVAGGILIVVTVIGLVLFRNWKYEQELDSLLWKIDFRDIQINDETSTTMGTKITRENSVCQCTQSENIPKIKIDGPDQYGTAPEATSVSLSYATATAGIATALHPLIRTSQVSLSSNPDADFRYSSIFTQIGIYKGRVLAIKKVHKKSIDITREMKKELKMIRDLRHDNLNAFIGACTDPPNICIITEYCTRGSLKDILENEDVKLDNMFIASLVGDILRGMIYLHDSPVRFHGSLHTANCLVDSRWVVKLADYGLREFKKGAEDPALKDPAKILEKCRMLLYRAPELLRMSELYIDYNQPCGTQKGDVYSFGIILYELHSRHGPFGDTGLSSAEILNRVIHCVETPFRPSLDSLEYSFDFVRDCLKECWSENPDERPDFKSIRAKLRPLRKGMKPNIFDNMMAMMEKYANNLEVLVDERTDQLQEEKKKTEALLYEMLPKPVAEQLKRGNKVEAEGFDCVTIYFSDIVGFTSMSAESTPLQVVNFLNDLYTCFDSIIENYDVYKVETIGDAYMVVSGLPIRNNIQHAAEVATMSLHLLSEVKTFTIRHRPQEKLMLRIGIHSGPVCAGVVGLKMPRYCLFGDTVNTASRMESTGMPLKIHCSKQCQELLLNLGGYYLVERGLVAMKGKGDQQTYWLVGEDETLRAIRTIERQKRRCQNSNRSLKNGLDSNGHCIIPRSSLKNKSSIPRSPLPRCSSFESPKKLRFANSDHLETKRCDFLEVITDNSPCKKSVNSLIEAAIDCASEAWKTSSTSCPCIENLANSTATLAHSQLSMFSRDEKCIKLIKPTCSSVPVLYPSLTVPKIPILKTISAPSSPKKHELVILSRFPECEEVLPWADCMPLLQITDADDQKTDI